MSLLTRVRCPPRCCFAHFLRACLTSRSESGRLPSRAGSRGAVPPALLGDERRVGGVYPRWIPACHNALPRAPRLSPRKASCVETRAERKRRNMRAFVTPARGRFWQRLLNVRAGEFLRGVRFVVLFFRWRMGGSEDPTQKARDEPRAERRHVPGGKRPLEPLGPFTNRSQRHPWCLGKVGLRLPVRPLRPAPPHNGHTAQTPRHVSLPLPRCGGCKEEGRRRGSGILFLTTSSSSRRRRRRRCRHSRLPAWPRPCRSRRRTSTT